ncbi:MAG TPA: SMP-30/gluconolactonase/LRE family protein [Acidimicrobiales bacterium]|nr:SMP-30/gluconolactonase/LRE family protein [Acidimicrobiales bacterium]
MTEASLTELADGLGFPEGPVVLPDGDLLVCELRTGHLVRVPVDGSGTKTVVAECGGSTNGAAIGPDGAVYVCNSGGWRWTELGGMSLPGDHDGTQADDYIGGRIQRVDLSTGTVTDVYTECDGHPLRAPNDLVFDATGGFWFTDHGHMRRRERDRGGVYYATPDGSSIREVIYPIDAPNGVGLSPDGATLYVAETHTGRVQSWALAGPGRLADPSPPFGIGATLLHGAGGSTLFDSLAVDSEGYVCVATIGNGGITVVSADGESVQHAALPDPLTTNICFGGPDRRTAFVTLSATGKLVSFDWPRPGLPLAF